MAAGVYSVTQVNSYIKNMFTQDFLLNRIFVKGEVSNCKYHPSGHIYFTIKDSGGALAAVMFAGNRKGLNFPLQNGQQIIAGGNINVYERDGKYQLYVNRIELDGEGDLYRKFEELKKELEEMGMFDASYKQPIPRYASRIGVVTASTGAAIQDILNISHRRNPYVQIILYPAIVQGANAAASIVRGIEQLEKQEADVIIVGRGGGSIEDLWAFNEESVARAIFNCTVPVISAVGHETDFTIADFVADLRAPTPSAAAELAVADILETESILENYVSALKKSMQLKCEALRQQLSVYQMRIGFRHPVNVLRTKRQETADYTERLLAALKAEVVRKRHELAIYGERLSGVSPLLKLNQGYSYVEHETGGAVCDVNQAKPGNKLNIYVKNGVIHSAVESVSVNGFLNKWKS